MSWNGRLLFTVVSVRDRTVSLGAFLLCLHLCLYFEKDFV
jgi:hypothetical protein